MEARNQEQTMEHENPPEYIQNPEMQQFPNTSGMMPAGGVQQYPYQPSGLPQAQGMAQGLHQAQGMAQGLPQAQGMAQGNAPYGSNFKGTPHGQYQEGYNPNQSYSGGYPQRQYGFPNQPQQYYPSTMVQNSVIVDQPQTIALVPGVAPRPSSNLGLAIFTTICCNLLFGIIAIIFSVMSSDAASAGKYDEAHRHGKTSAILSIVGICLGVITIVVCLVLVFVVFDNGNQWD